MRREGHSHEMKDSGHKVDQFHYLFCHILSLDEEEGILTELVRKYSTKGLSGQMCCKYLLFQGFLSPFFPSWRTSLLGWAWPLISSPSLGIL